MLLKLRRYRWYLLGRRQIKKLIRHNNAPLKIIIGAGETSYEGWVATDIPHFDALKKEDWEFFFKTHRPQNILTEHVLEHLTEDQVQKVLTNAYKYLKSGGKFRIAVPDAYHAEKEYIEAVKPGGWDIGSDDHKSFWSIDSLSTVGSKAGFKVVPLEYYTSDHTFRSSEYDFSDGYIVRSSKNNYTDPKVPGYTSLIVDLIKE